MDNSPHVPFFKPIIQELKKLDISILTTARDAFQVKDLLKELSVTADLIGHHDGKNKILKIVGLFRRASQLCPSVVKFKPALAVSHGSRSQMILARLLGIRTILILDYEFVTLLPFFLPKYIIMPKIVSSARFLARGIKVLHYPGIKEDVYLPSFSPRPNILEELGILDKNKIIVTIREPATEAHYFVPESEKLFECTMDHLSSRNDLIIIILPRNSKRSEYIKNRWPSAYLKKRLIIPEHAVDGLSLLWNSDLVISGGGTMNREAATLDIPVYTIFQGETGAVDRYLSESGRLIMIKTQNDIANQIKIQKRIKRQFKRNEKSNIALDTIIQFIQKIIDE